jgi:Concanavalin A-like lectin/glucanases superfamily
MSLYAGNSQEFSGAVNPTGTEGTISMACWVWIPPKYVSSGTRGVFFRTYGATFGYVSFALWNGGSTTVPQIIISTQNSAGTSANAYINKMGGKKGTWVHLGVIINGTTVYTTVNGIPENAQPTAAVSVSYSGAITSYIGGCSGSHPYKVSDIQVWSRVLTIAELTAVYNGAYLNPNGRYCVGAGMSGTDLTGNGNNLDVVGTLSGVFTGADDPPHITLNTTLSNYNKRTLRPFRGTGRLRMLPASDVADASWLNELDTNTNMYASID